VWLAHHRRREQVVREGFADGARLGVPVSRSRWARDELHLCRREAMERRDEAVDHETAEKPLSPRPVEKLKPERTVVELLGLISIQTLSSRCKGCTGISRS
jgi:hypothetical protein